jgi:hypothetical protein
MAASVESAVVTRRRRRTASVTWPSAATRASRATAGAKARTASGVESRPHAPAVVLLRCVVCAPVGRSEAMAAMTWTAARSITGPIKHARVDGTLFRRVPGRAHKSSTTRTAASPGAGTERAASISACEPPAPGWEQADEDGVGAGSADGWRLGSGRSPVAPLGVYGVAPAPAETPDPRAMPMDPPRDAPMATWEPLEVCGRAPLTPLPWDGGRAAPPALKEEEDTMVMGVARLTGPAPTAPYLDSLARTRPMCPRTTWDRCRDTHAR